MRTGREGAVLAAGLLTAVAAGLAPAGLHGRPVPPASWAVWTAAAAGAALLAGRSERGLVRAATTLAWLAPAVILLTLPAVFFAVERHRAVVAAALVARALAAAAATVATVTVLGPPGVVRGLRALRVPRRLVDVVHAMLVGLGAMVRQATAMQRARAARRARRKAFATVAAAPVETVLGFGRLTAALLLRTLERAEALERARRARGGAER